MDLADPVAPSSWLTFTRAEWAQLRRSAPLGRSPADPDTLRSADPGVSLEEVAEVYLPLCRLLDLRFAAARGLARATDTFLGAPPEPIPYVIGLAGSVAVGKSTSARVLQELLSRGPAHLRVDLVTTDGFLFPNRVLEQRGILARKGFPESYDLPALLGFLAAVKDGRGDAAAPVYSHVQYDIAPDRQVLVRRPDILILEGLNVLQSGASRDERAPSLQVSDFLDFSIYLDAAESDLEVWFLERFRQLRESTFRDPTSHFRAYAAMPEEEALAAARQVWATINAVNLREHVAPTRERARLVLEKGPSHRVERVRLRRV